MRQREVEMTQDKRSKGVLLVPGETLAPSALAIGEKVRQLRKAKGWNLATLSAESDIPQSTLSKFETGSLSLPLDRVFRLADSLGISVTDFFDQEHSEQDAVASGRRSISRASDGPTVRSGNYDSRWLFPDLLRKRMFPVIQTINARSIEEFGPLLRHEGEEFSLVLKGRVSVITDIYGPVILEVNDGIYIDSRMGHAYINEHEGESQILNVSTSLLGNSPGEEE